MVKTADPRMGRALSLMFDSLAHFLVDALCVTTLFSSGADDAFLNSLLILYNSLAFSTQCLTGILVDHLRSTLPPELCGIALTVLGALLPLPFALRVCLIGLGNSLFHVAAGASVLKNSGGKAWQLGVFVAPGAFGVTLGTSYPVFGAALTVALLLCAVLRILFRGDEKEPAWKTERQNSFPLLPVVLLTCAVAVRALGGVAVSFPWKTTVLAGFLMTFFVFSGKAAGGFLCDRFGAAKTALLSLPLAAVLIAFCSGNMFLSLAGQFLLNLTMPVTLWLMVRAMPDSPGFAFGLAASALWPGTVAGLLLPLTGPALGFCVLLSFCLGLIAILVAGRSPECSLDPE